jgi:MSHA biogenesis protein MshK
VFRYLLLLLILSTASALAQEGVIKERDPTRPLGYQKVSGKTGSVRESELRLSSVLISAQRKLAIINGQSLSEGQVIPDSNGVSLVSIHSQGVVVQQAGRRWELRLAPRIIKKN